MISQGLVISSSNTPLLIDYLLDWLPFPLLKKLPTSWFQNYHVPLCYCSSLTLLLQECVNPIPVGRLPFVGGGHWMPPPSKIGPYWTWKAFLESFKKIMGVSYILKMPKNTIYLAKNAIKNQTVFFCFVFLSGKSRISLIRNLRLPFSNANSEACVWDINAIQVLSGV